ncbi:hypothetical protein LEP1GSC061_0530 [Leptospira wolffii serovar Khorat str. Khorat-H2]|nr:hypothetical protein LEP1GSC061_0530 [Leptospira wolffii serovar Khorat str. Khorat-H2]
MSNLVLHAGRMFYFILPSIRFLKEFYLILFKKLPSNDFV